MEFFSALFTQTSRTSGITRVACRGVGVKRLGMLPKAQLIFCLCGTLLIHRFMTSQQEATSNHLKQSFCVVRKTRCLYHRGTSRIWDSMRRGGGGLRIGWKLFKRNATIIAEYFGDEIMLIWWKDLRKSPFRSSARTFTPLAQLTLAGRIDCVASAHKLLQTEPSPFILCLDYCCMFEKFHVHSITSCLVWMSFSGLLTSRVSVFLKIWHHIISLLWYYYYY